MSNVKDRPLSEEKLSNLPIVGKKPKSEKEEKHLREIEEFEFANILEPGVGVKFVYGNTSNNHTFTLLHGGKYRFPRFLARYIETRSKPIWKWFPDGTGLMRKQQMGTDPRFRMTVQY